MTHITISVYTREDIQKMYNSAASTYNTMVDLEKRGKKLTGFGSYRKNSAKTSMDKWNRILEAFPGKQEFTLINGRLVEVSITNISEEK